MKKHKPNDIVPDTGIYYELMPNGEKITKITCVKGEKFPPTLGLNNYYELKTVSVRQLVNQQA